MFKDFQLRICPIKMWRFLNSIPRAFRQQCHGPRASVGVHVEESEQESQVQASHENCFHEKPEGKERQQINQDFPSNCSDTVNVAKEEFVTEINQKKSLRSLFLGWNPRQEGFFSHFDANQREGTKNKKGEGQWWRSCRHDLCAILNRNHLFEILTVGSCYGWGSETKLTAKKRWLYRVLFSLSSGDSALHLNDNKIPVECTVPSEDKSQQDGKNFDIKIPEVVSAPINEDDRQESIESALDEFQEICKDYSSKSESLLGLAAAEGGDMPVAIQHLKKACLMGNISACFNVGLCYETGAGVPKQLERAVEYYEKAAKNGHSLAMYNLGLIYLNGDSYSEGSQERGLLLIEESAKVGLAEAQTQMGIFCMEQDNAGDAFDYFTAAANQNDCEAQYFLAMCYEQGLGVEEDMEKSSQYYSIAATSGHEGAMYNLAIYTELGLGGIIADPVGSVDLYKKAAEAGHTRAQSRLEELAAEKAVKQGQENEMLLKQENSSSGSLRRSSSGSSSLSSWMSSPNLIGHYTDVTSLFFPETGHEESYSFSFVSNSETHSKRSNSVEFYTGEGNDVFGLKSLGWSLTVKRPEASVSKDLDQAKMSYPLYGHFHKSHTSPNLSALVTCST